MRNTFVRKKPAGVSVALLQDRIYERIDFPFVLIRVNQKVLVAGEHCGKLRARLAVEDMHRNAVGFSISQFVTNTKRWRSTFRNNYIGFPKPGSILLIYCLITVCQAFGLTLRQVSNMLCQDNIVSLYILYNVLIYNSASCLPPRMEPAKYTFFPMS